MNQTLPGSFMRKLTLFPVLLIAGCIISGLYGILHDQLTYTLSPAYFHAFKFNQFQIQPSHHNRIGAAIVAWQATWWMGVIIGVPVLSLGLIMPDWKSYARHSLIAFAIVAVTALVVGLGALAYAYFTIDANHLPDFGYPRGVDKIAFARVGIMHNFSYSGGFIGILTGALYLVVARVRIALRARRAADGR